MESLITKWISEFINVKEKNTHLKYNNFRKWVFAHICFDGLSSYGLIVMLKRDRFNALQESILSFEIPVVIPEKDYEVMAKTAALRILKTAEEVYQSDAV